MCANCTYTPSDSRPLDTYLTFLMLFDVPKLSVMTQNYIFVGPGQCKSSTLQPIPSYVLCSIVRLALCEPLHCPSSMTLLVPYECPSFYALRNIVSTPWLLITSILDHAHYRSKRPVSLAMLHKHSSLGIHTLSTQRKSIPIPNNDVNISVLIPVVVALLFNYSAFDVSWPILPQTRCTR